MRIFTRLALMILLLAALAFPALAAGTPVDLPSGETVMLMHPGVDGVEAPWAVRSRMIAPRYPDHAERLTGGTSVTVAVLVLADGSLGQVEVIEARDPGRGYEEAAKNAVSRWTFRPGRLDGEPVNSYQMYSIEFPEPLLAFSSTAMMSLSLSGNPSDTFLLSQLPGQTGMSGGSASAAGNSTMGFRNGARVRVASTPQFVTGQLTDLNNRGRDVGTTGLAAKNGR